MAQQPNACQVRLILEACRSHTMKPRSAGLLWTSDRPVAETSTWKHTTLTRETAMPPARFKPTIPATERPQTLVLDRSATEIGIADDLKYFNGLCMYWVQIIQTRSDDMWSRNSTKYKWNMLMWMSVKKWWSIVSMNQENKYLNPNLILCSYILYVILGLKLLNASVIMEYTLWQQTEETATS